MNKGIETKKEPCFQKRICGGIKVFGRTAEFHDQRNLNKKGNSFVKERVLRNKGEITFMKEQRWFDKAKIIWREK